MDGKQDYDYLYYLTTLECGDEEQPRIRLDAQYHVARWSFVIEHRENKSSLVKVLCEKT